MPIGHNNWQIRKLPAMPAATARQGVTTPWQPPLTPPLPLPTIPAFIICCSLEYRIVPTVGTAYIVSYSPHPATSATTTSTPTNRGAINPPSRPYTNLEPIVGKNGANETPLQRCREVTRPGDARPHHRNNNANKRQLSRVATTSYKGTRGARRAIFTEIIKDFASSANFSTTETAIY